MCFLPLSKFDPPLALPIPPGINCRGSPPLRDYERYPAEEGESSQLDDLDRRRCGDMYLLQILQRQNRVRLVGRSESDLNYETERESAARRTRTPL